MAAEHSTLMSPCTRLRMRWSLFWIKIVILPNTALNIDRCEGEERDLSGFCSASEALSASTWLHPFSNESLVFPVVCPGVIS